MYVINATYKNSMSPELLQRLTDLGMDCTQTYDLTRYTGDDRTAEACSEWYGSDPMIVCPDCGDYCRVNMSIKKVPECSCLALRVMAEQQHTARFRAFADHRASRHGRCCIEGCDAPGRWWYRRTTPAGVRAVRGCEAHHRLAEYLLANVTMDECVRLATPVQRRRAMSIAAAESAKADAASRMSASLRGASSLTHTYSLVAGAHQREADCQRAFARAVQQDS